MRMLSINAGRPILCAPLPRQGTLPTQRMPPNCALGAVQQRTIVYENASVADDDVMLNPAYRVLLSCESGNVVVVATYDRLLRVPSHIKLLCEAAAAKGVTLVIALAPQPFFSSNPDFKSLRPGLFSETSEWLSLLPRLYEAPVQTAPPFSAGREEGRRVAGNPGGARPRLRRYGEVRLGCGQARRHPSGRPAEPRAGASQAGHPVCPAQCQSLHLPLGRVRPLWLLHQKTPRHHRLPLPLRGLQGGDRPGPLRQLRTQQHEDGRNLRIWRGMSTLPFLIAILINPSVSQSFQPSQPRFPKLFVGETQSIVFVEQYMVVGQGGFPRGLDLPLLLPQVPKGGLPRERV